MRPKDRMIVGCMFSSSRSRRHQYFAMTQIMKPTPTRATLPESSSRVNHYSLPKPPPIMPNPPALLTVAASLPSATTSIGASRSEEHTSELQSPCNLVCRLLLEKKKQ